MFPIINFTSNLFLSIRCFFIWPRASISIYSVAVFAFLWSSSEPIFRPEELIGTGPKLGLPASKRHMLISARHVPFGSREVQFWTRIWSGGSPTSRDTCTEIWGDGKSTRPDEIASNRISCSFFLNHLSQISCSFDNIFIHLKIFNCPSFDIYDIYYIYANLFLISVVQDHFGYYQKGNQLEIIVF